MRKIVIDVTNIKTRKDLAALLNQEMQFEGWYGPKLDEWIEMVSLFETENHVGIPTRFKSSEQEFFVLEIENAYEMMLATGSKSAFRYMIKIFRQVNREYRERYGRSILGLSLL